MPLPTRTVSVVSDLLSRHHLSGFATAFAEKGLGIGKLAHMSEADVYAVLTRSAYCGVGRGSRLRLQLLRRRLGPMLREAVRIRSSVPVSSSSSWHSLVCVLMVLTLALSGLGMLSSATWKRPHIAVPVRKDKEAVATTFLEQSFGGVSSPTTQHLEIQTPDELCRDCVIVVIAYNRPLYFMRVLDSLAACRGIERYIVHFFLEPTNPEVIRLAWRFSAARKQHVHINSKRLGCHANKKQAVTAAFELEGETDFVVVLEDDTPLSPDALRYFEHARERYASDPTVFTVSAYAGNCHRAGERVPRGMMMRAALGRRRHYTPWGWGIWRDRWREIRDSWDGWDVQMNFRTPPYNDVANGLAAPDFSRFDRGLRRDRVEVFPLWSRSNNIGFEGGMHSLQTSPEEAFARHYIHSWAGGEDGSGDGTTDPSFHEIDSADVRRACEVIPFGSDTARTMCAFSPSL